MFVLDEIRWAKLSGDLSWQKKILIDDLLPSVGSEVEFWDARPMNEGYVNFLWLPPHSEFNGFNDRPYEFLKARIISGVLKEISSDLVKKKHQYKFTVNSVKPISDTLNEVKTTKVIYVNNGVEVSRQSYVSETVTDLAYVGWCDFLGGGNLIYLYEYYYESSYCSFIVEKNGEFFLIFEYQNVAGITRGELMKVKLLNDDIKRLDEIIRSVEPFDCTGRYLLADDEVQGAEYC